MKVPKVRRRWVALAVVIVILLATLRLLYQPLTLESYRTLDPQTLVVVGHGAREAWTTGVRCLRDAVNGHGQRR